MIGTAIGHYEITGTLGEGGMGVVYAAYDTRLQRDVAIKFLTTDASNDPAGRERFLREARAASALNHPNICTIYDVGEHDGRAYLVMELVRGKTLLELAASRETVNVLSLIDQAAEGLAAAHAKQVVHRDIKSSNVMVTDDGRVKIMDFGLAMFAGRSSVTTVGSSLGTLAYMPPEQARGEAVDQRADVYALGVVLFELLTGSRPFNAPYDHAVLYQVLNEPAPAPSSRTQGIAPSVDAIVQRCLAKDPADRYPTMAALRLDLAAAMTGEKVPGTPAVKPGPSRPRSRRPIMIVAATLAIAAAAYLLAGRDGLDSFSSAFGGAAVPAQKHLAVLPFANIGDDPARQSLCDGLTETMTSQLTQLEQFHGALWVVPASEVRRGNVVSAEDARKAFGVNLAVDGSLQMIGDRYRLSLNLVDAATLRQLNSASIDLGTHELAALHDGAVMRMLEMLHVELHPEIRAALQSGGTTVPSAYEYYLRGRGALLRYEAEENIDNAILAFRKGVREDTAYALSYAALGEALWRKYEAGKDTRWVQEAIDACERAKHLDGTLAPVNVTLGIVYLGTGKPRMAIQLFQAALTMDPSSAEAYRGLAKAHEASGDLTAAEQTYQRAIGLRPDYWGGHNDLGVFYSRNSRYEDAISSFRRVTELTPDNNRGFNNLGGMYYYLRRWQEAQDMFERSYAIHPSYRPASNLGTLAYIQGHFEEAARWYEKARAHNASDHVVTGNLASAYYWSSENHAKAASMFVQAIDLATRQLEVNPDDAEVLALLGGYYAMTGDVARAKRFAERSLALSPNDASVMFRAGTTYEQIGNRERALEWIGKAVASGYSRSEVANQPELRELYKDPRYTAMLSKP